MSGIQVMCLGGATHKIADYREITTLCNAASGTGADIIPVCEDYKTIVVVEKYTKAHVDDPLFVQPEQGAPKTCDLPECDQKWFDGLYEQNGSQFMLNLIMAADRLGYGRLYHSLCAWIAKEWIKGKTPEQIRQIFGIKNDLAGTEAAGTEAAGAEAAAEAAN